MKTSCTFLVSIFMLLGISNLDAQTIQYADALSTQGFSMKTASNAAVSVSFSIHQLTFEDHLIDGKRRTGISMPENLLFNDAGYPNLPGNGRMIAIPQGSVPKLRVISLRVEVIHGLDIIPAPRIPKETESGPLEYTPNLAVYSTNAFYPIDPVKISVPFTVRGVDVVTLGITPFQYNPVTKELRIMRDITLEIAFEGGTGQFGEERLRSRYWDPILEDALMNYTSLPMVDYGKRATQVLDDPGFEYLIITPTGSDFLQWADSIRRFRIRQGITTTVKTLSEVGGNTTTAIEAYINNAYTTWNPAPAAVLLLGDYGTDATNSVVSPIYNSYCVSDNIYGDVDGNHLPDVCMARITANNAAQLQVMVSKFLNYERNPPTSAYFYQHPISALGWQTERWFQLCSEVVGGFWKYNQLKDPVRINEIYSGTPGTVWSTATNTNTVVSYFGSTGLNYIPDSPSSMTCCWSGGNATAINTAINAGAFCLLHRDHGGEAGWGEPAYSSTNINSLTNVNNQLPFVFSVNCLTGKYNYSSEVFSEKFHRYTYNGQNSGALGLIAASEISYSFVNDVFCWGMMDNFWPNFMPAYGTNPASRGFLPCFGNAAGKYFLYQSSWPYNTGDKEVTYNLFHHHGDAFSVVYSEIPQNLVVNHVTTINASENTFTITANAGSLIALTIGDQLLGTATGTGNPVTVNFSISLIPGQFIHVTVTKQNYFRYDAEVEVVPSNGPYFIANPTQICAGSPIDFTDLSSGSPLSWDWSFPGGTPSANTLQHPQDIVYTAPGTYDVTLTITTAAGTSTFTRTNYITIDNVEAEFTATPTMVVVGNSVTFTDNSTCQPASWEWSFPGGTPSTCSGQAPPPVMYNAIGTYSVSLTVSKPSGTNTKTKTNYITVTPPIYNISNSTITACTGDFYDSGGSAGAYQNGENYTMTFLPSTPGSAIRAAFTAFSTESGYDYLRIYDGTTTTAALIGTYHGTTGPGIVVANNASGALTFNFTSDGSATSTGWAAGITCLSGIVFNPATFTAVAQGTSQINLNWAPNTSSQPVMVVFSMDNIFGIPVNGNVYNAGSAVSGGGTVICAGTMTSFSHTGLNPSTTYYYKIFSCDAANTYSTGVTASTSTHCGLSLLPLNEPFATSTLPTCWTKQISGTGAVDKWTVSNTAYAGGTAYEMKSTFQNINPATTRLVTPPINTTGIPSLNLSFRHMLDAYGTGCTLRVQSSTDGTNWTNEAWSVAATSTNIAATTVSTAILNNMNSPATLIAFTIEGNLYQYDYWYIDNVTVTSGCTSTNPVSVSISASANNIVAGTQVAFTATPVNGGTTPVCQWKVNGLNQGANSATFEYTPANNDVISCMVTSNAMCTTGNPATSNTITMVVATLPAMVSLQNVTVSLTDCFDSAQTITVAGSGTTFTVLNGGSATMIAGENIIYYPGVSVEPGGYLYGYIAPQGPWCPVQAKPVTVNGQQAPAAMPADQFIRVYPNPTNGEFTVELVAGNKLQRWVVDIYNMQGVKVRSETIEEFSSARFSLAGSSHGIYLVRASNGTQTGTVRIVRLP